MVRFIDAAASLLEDGFAVDVLHMAGSECLIEMILQIVQDFLHACFDCIFSRARYIPSQLRKGILSSSDASL